MSTRIIKYRDILGGFTSKGQLKEVYGLKDSVLTQMDTLIYIADDFSPQMIDINKITEYALGRHPYVNKKLAKAITAYRYQHGHFTTADELENIHLMDSLTINRLLPYLSF